MSEHFVPGKIHDDRLFNYNLQPAQVIPTDQLLGRAEQLRQQAVPLESADPLAEPLPLPVGPSPQQAPPDSGAFPQDGRVPF